MAIKHKNYFGGLNKKNPPQKLSRNTYHPKTIMEVRVEQTVTKTQIINLTARGLWSADVRFWTVSSDQKPQASGILLYISKGINISP